MSLVTEPVEKVNTVLVYRTKKKVLRSEKWRWSISASNAKPLARSSEGYANLSDLLDSLATVLGVEKAQIFDPEGWQLAGLSVQRVNRQAGHPVVVITHG